MVKNSKVSSATPCPDISRAPELSSRYSDRVQRVLQWHGIHLGDGEERRTEIFNGNYGVDIC